MIPSPSPLVGAAPPPRRAVFFGDSRADWWLTPVLPGLQCVNAGVPGASAAYLARRFQPMIAPLRPDIVVVQLGVNDLVGLTPGSPDRERVVAAVLSATASVAAVNQGLPGLAGAEGPLLDSAAVLTGPDGYVRPAYAEDEVHLSAAGYAALNAAFTPLLSQ